MYEKPTLNRVGAAQDVILGFMFVGTDLDGTFNPPGGTEWSDEAAENPIR